MNSTSVALIVGGGPGISASCARLFVANGMRVGVAARNPDKPVLEALEREHGVRRYGCDASEPSTIARPEARIMTATGIRPVSPTV